jgi:predicted MFS family arabinose efflux permease
LRTLLLSSTWFNLMEQAMMATFFVFAVRVAGLSSSTVAMALGAGAAGSVLGAVLANRVSSKGDPRHRLVVYAGLAAVAPVALNLLPQAGGSAVALAIGIFALYGIGLTSYNVEAISLRQRNLPDGAQGKTGAAYRLFAYGALAAGGLLSALLVTLFGVSAALVFATVTLVVGWVALVPIYLRGLTAAA